MNKVRFEALTDGIIAIIITIMILEIHLPKTPDIDGAKDLFPVIISYAISFVHIGMNWQAHHNLFNQCERINKSIIFINLVMIFWLSFVPLTTLWLWEQGIQIVPTFFYVANIFLVSLSFKLLTHAVFTSRDHIDYSFKKLLRFERLSIGLSLLSLSASIYNPVLAFVIIGIVGVYKVLRTEEFMRNS